MMDGVDGLESWVCSAVLSICSVGQCANGNGDTTTPCYHTTILNHHTTKLPHREELCANGYCVCLKPWLSYQSTLVDYNTTNHRLIFWLLRGLTSALCPTTDLRRPLIDRSVELIHTILILYKVV